MLEDRQIERPHCGETTAIGVASPDTAGKYEPKGSMTACRKCGGRIITLTEQDGTVQVLKP